MGLKMHRICMWMGAVVPFVFSVLLFPMDFGWRLWHRASSGPSLLMLLTEDPAEEASLTLEDRVSYKDLLDRLEKRKDGLKMAASVEKGKGKKNEDDGDGEGQKETELELKMEKARDNGSSCQLIVLASACPDQVMASHLEIIGALDLTHENLPNLIYAVESCCTFLAQLEALAHHKQPLLSFYVDVNNQMQQFMAIKLVPILQLQLDITRRHLEQRPSDQLKLQLKQLLFLADILLHQSCCSLLSHDSLDLFYGQLDQAKACLKKLSTHHHHHQKPIVKSLKSPSKHNPDPQIQDLVSSSFSTKTASSMSSETSSSNDAAFINLTLKDTELAGALQQVKAEDAALNASLHSQPSSSSASVIHVDQPMDSTTLQGSRSTSFLKTRRASMPNAIRLSQSVEDQLSRYDSQLSNPLVPQRSTIPAPLLHELEKLPSDLKIDLGRLLSVKIQPLSVDNILLSIQAISAKKADLKANKALWPLLQSHLSIVFMADLKSSTDLVISQSPSEANLRCLQKLQAIASLINNFVL